MTERIDPFVTSGLLEVELNGDPGTTGADIEVWQDRR